MHDKRREERVRKGKMKIVEDIREAFARSAFVEDIR
jgi:flagellar motor switch protein FliM